MEKELLDQWTTLSRDLSLIKEILKCPVLSAYDYSYNLRQQSFVAPVTVGNVQLYLPMAVVLASSSG